MNQEIVDKIIDRFREASNYLEKEKNKLRLDTVKELIDDYPEEVHEAVRYYNRHVGCVFGIFDCGGMDCGDKRCIENTFENILYNYNCTTPRRIERRAN